MASDCLRIAEESFERASFLHCMVTNSAVSLESNEKSIWESSA